MNSSIPNQSKAETYYLYVFCIIISLIPFLGVNIPRVYTFLPAAIASIGFGLYYFFGTYKPQISIKAAILVLITLSLSATSLLWAKHFDISKAKVIKLLALLPPQILLISFITSLTKEQLNPIAKLLPMGFLAAVGLLGFEILTKGTFYNLIRGIDASAIVDPDDFNRGAVSLSLYSFIIFALLGLKINKWKAALLSLLPLTIITFLSESQSAQLCMIVGLIFLFAFPYQSKIAFRSLKFLILALVFTAPFFITHIYENFAQTIQDIPGMSNAYAGIRLEIWDFISRYALQEPVHGYGIEMTRETIDFDSKREFFKEDTILHPHNFAIQIWVEFGIIGISILMGLIYALFTSIERNFTTTQQKIILPTVMATLVPASFAYGMWQSQWIGLMFHIAAITLIASTLLHEEKKA